MVPRVWPSSRTAIDVRIATFVNLSLEGAVVCVDFEQRDIVTILVA